MALWYEEDSEGKTIGSITTLRGTIETSAETSGLTTTLEAPLTFSLWSFFVETGEAELFFDNKKIIKMVVMTA